MNKLTFFLLCLFFSGNISLAKSMEWQPFIDVQFWHKSHVNYPNEKTRIFNLLKKKFPDLEFKRSFVGRMDTIAIQNSKPDIPRLEELCVFYRKFGVVKKCTVSPAYNLLSEMKAVPIEWNCAQTNAPDKINPLPVKRTLNSFNEFSQMIAIAQGGNTDYSSCFYLSISDYYHRLQQSCATKIVSTGLCELKIEEFLKPYRESAIVFAEAQDKKISLPTFESGLERKEGMPKITFDKNKCWLDNLDAGVDRDFLNNDLPKILPQVDYSCSKRIYNSLKSKIENQLFMAGCAFSETSDPMCTKARNNNQALLNSLEQYKPTRTEITYIEPVATLAEAQGVDCENILEIGSPIANLGDLDKALEQITGCLNLKPSDPAKIIDLDGDKTPTTVEHKYKLKRLDDKTYEAAINLNFLKPSGASGDGLQAAAKAQAEMRDKVRACISIANEKLLGPDGKRLRLRLASPEEANPPPVVNIALFESLPRENAHAYSMKSDCPTLTHEMLHLLGLCDEYKETSMGFVRDEQGAYQFIESNDKNSAEIPYYDCRVLGAADSIMNDSYAAYDGAFGLLMELTCYCGESDFKCVNELKNWSGGMTCPIVMGNTRSTRSYAGEAFEVMKWIDNFTLKHVRLLQTQKSEGASLLKPQHFMNIIEPGCQKTNSDYYQCAQNAYASTHVQEFIYDEATNQWKKDALGRDQFSLKEKACPVAKDKLPKSCSNGSADWVNKTQ